MQVKIGASQPGYPIYQTLTDYRTWMSHLSQAKRPLTPKFVPVCRVSAGRQRCCMLFRHDYLTISHSDSLLHANSQRFEGPAVDVIVHLRTMSLSRTVRLSEPYRA